MNYRIFILITFFVLFSCSENSEKPAAIKQQTSIPVSKKDSLFHLNSTTQLKDWGLGKKLSAKKSNDVTWDWYIDQLRTGRYYMDNCGPAVATMAIKWADSSFHESPVLARNTYVKGGGDWYTSDIIAYLNDNQINNYILRLDNQTNYLKNIIDSGDIAVLCIDTYYINYTYRKNWRKNRFYKTRQKGNGHFIIVKGYLEVDTTLYFEVYDPFSMGKRYKNNTLKGIDRYYTYNNLMAATNNWWDYAIVVTRKKIKNDPFLTIPKNEHKPGS